MAEPLFLGLDLSTQQLKAILITASSNIVHEAAIHFDKDLPHYGTTNGALHGDATFTREGVVAAPVTMWLDALDLLFERMETNGVDFSLIKAVGGERTGIRHSISCSIVSLTTSSNMVPSIGQQRPLRFYRISILQSLSASSYLQQHSHCLTLRSGKTLLRLRNVFDCKKTRGVPRL